MDKSSLYRAAIAADEKFSRELVRQFGSRAGDMRYSGRAEYDDETRQAQELKRAADAALFPREN